jgi:hypothetical protein
MRLKKMKILKLSKACIFRNYKLNKIESIEWLATTVTKLC